MPEKYQSLSAPSQSLFCATLRCQERFKVTLTLTPPSSDKIQINFLIGTYKEDLKYIIMNY